MHFYSHFINPRGTIFSKSMRFSFFIKIHCNTHLLTNLMNGLYIEERSTSNTSAFHILDWFQCFFFFFVHFIIPNFLLHSFRTDILLSEYYFFSPVEDTKNGNSINSGILLVVNSHFSMTAEKKCIFMNLELFQKRCVFISILSVDI